MKKKTSKTVPVTASPPYALRIEYRQADHIAGGGSSDGNSVEAILEAMADLPPNDEYEVVSTVQFEGVCLTTEIKPKQPEDRLHNDDSATLTVWAPSKEEASQLLKRALRAHFSGPGWWQSDHPNYRPHPGN